MSSYARTLRQPFDISYWRLSSGIEVKGKARVRSHDARHLLQFRKDYPAVRELLLVCCESEARVTDKGVRILPWRDFIERLWSGELPLR